jgi:hypothetical protein
LLTLSTIKARASSSRQTTNKKTKQKNQHGRSAMNVMQAPRRDEGTAYEMRSADYKADLVHVGRGTPMGELLRRYWHPVALAAHAT